VGKVARQVAEQAGVDINVKEIIEDARAEDRNHFEALTSAFTN
jgi:hypothetical protein